MSPEMGIKPCFSSVVPGLDTSSGNLLEMQNLGPHPDLLHQNEYLHRLPRGFLGITESQTFWEIISAVKRTQILFLLSLTSFSQLSSSFWVRLTLLFSIKFYWYEEIWCYLLLHPSINVTNLTNCRNISSICILMYLSDQFFEDNRSSCYGEKPCWAGQSSQCPSCHSVWPSGNTDLC